MYPIVWESPICGSSTATMNVYGNTLVKSGTSVGDGNQCSAIGINTLGAFENGSVEATLSSSADGYVYFLLRDVDADSNSPYAGGYLVYPDGQFYVYDLSQNSLVSVSNYLWQAGDRVRVSRSAVNSCDTVGVANYYVNDQLIYTTSINNTLSIKPMVMIFGDNGSIENVNASFGLQGTLHTDGFPTVWTNSNDCTMAEIIDNSIYFNPMGQNVEPCIITSEATLQPNQEAWIEGNIIIDNTTTLNDGSIVYMGLIDTNSTAINSSIIAYNGQYMAYANSFENGVVIGTIQNNDRIGIDIVNICDSYQALFKINGVVRWVKNFSSSVPLKAYGFVIGEGSALTDVKLSFGTSPTNTDTSCYALNFNGFSNAVEVPNNDLLNFGSGDFTFEAWIKAKTTQVSYPQILSKRGINEEYEGFLVGLNYNGYLYAQFDGSHDGNGTTDLRDDHWHHIAVTRSSGSGVYYVDGVQEGTFNNTNNISSLASLWIGFDKPAPYWSAFNGLIDEVRIWNVARSQTQITNNANTNLLGTEAGLVAYYQMNEGSSSTVTDKTNNGFHGVLGSVEFPNNATPPSWQSNSTVEWCNAETVQPESEPMIEVSTNLYNAIEAWLSVENQTIALPTFLATFPEVTTADINEFMAQYFTTVQQNGQINAAIASLCECVIITNRQNSLMYPSYTVAPTQTFSGNGGACSDYNGNYNLTKHGPTHATSMNLSGEGENTSHTRVENQNAYYSNNFLYLCTENWLPIICDLACPKNIELSGFYNAYLQSNASANGIAKHRIAAQAAEAAILIAVDRKRTLVGPTWTPTILNTQILAFKQAQVSSYKVKSWSFTPFHLISLPAVLDVIKMNITEALGNLPIGIDDFINNPGIDVNAFSISAAQSSKNKSLSMPLSGQIVLLPNTSKSIMLISNYAMSVQGRHKSTCTNWSCSAKTKSNFWFTAIINNQDQAICQGNPVQVGKWAYSTINGPDTETDLKNQIQFKLEYATCEWEELPYPVVIQEQFGICTSDGIGNPCKTILTDDDISSPSPTLSLYPNPTRNHTTLQYNTNTSEAAIITLLDLSGKTMLINNEYATEGTNEFGIDTDQLPAGIYLVRLQTPTQSFTERLVVAQ